MAARPIVARAVLVPAGRSDRVGPVGLEIEAAAELPAVPGGEIDAVGVGEVEVSPVAGNHHPRRWQRPKGGLQRG